MRATVLVLLVLSLPMFVLSPRGGHARAATSGEESWHDSFETPGLEGYTIDGSVRVEGGAARLAPGATLSRAIASEGRFRVEVRLESPGAGEPSVAARLRIALASAEPIDGHLELPRASSSGPSSAAIDFDHGWIRVFDGRRRVSSDYVDRADHRITGWTLVAGADPLVLEEVQIRTHPPHDLSRYKQLQWFYFYQVLC